MSRMRQPRLWMGLLGAACLASVGLALLAQHRWGMEPCPWCILQRLLFVVLGVLALVAAAQPSGLGRRVIAGLSLPLAVGGAAAALWQHFVAAQTQSCALTLADKIIGASGLDLHFPEVFEVRASCADAAVDLLGVPFEFWSLALFAVAGVVLISTCLTPSRRA